MKKVSIPPTKEVLVSWLHPDPKNPRLIKRRDFTELKRRIKDFPEMLSFRPIVHDSKGKIIAGEKRHRAVTELGWKKVPGIDARSLNPKQVKQFMLWDNDHAGTWDFDELKKWPNLFGLEIPGKVAEKFNNDNAEMPIVPKYDEKYRAVLIITETEMDFANLSTVLELNREKDYKSIGVGQTHVIDYSRFYKLWNKK